MDKQHYASLANTVAKQLDTAQVHKFLKELHENFVAEKDITDDIAVAQYGMYIDAFGSKIKDFENDLGFQLNPDTFFDYGAVKLPYTQCIANLKYAQHLLTKYIHDVNNEKKMALRYDELPDYLTDKDLTKLFGWPLATIYTKRSNEEIPFVENGMMLFPKKELFDMLKSKIRNPFVSYDDIIEKELKAKQAKKKAKKDKA